MSKKVNAEVGCTVLAFVAGESLSRGFFISRAWFVQGSLKQHRRLKALEPTKLGFALVGSKGAASRMHGRDAS